MRRIGAPSFAAADFDLLARFMPHLQRALSIHRRLESVDLAQAAASEVLDRMPIGVAILGGDGKVLFLNRRAQTIVDTGDGLVLLREELSAATPDEAAALRRLVADACATGNGCGVGGTLTITRPSGRRALTALVAPLHARSFALALEAPAAVAFIGDPEPKVEGIGGMLRQLYGLTKAEATVAILLVEGRRTEELVDLLGITLHTARTHVKRVLAKVDVRCQSELVRVLLGGAAGLRLESP
jgi:DNA-binding CsgD family transcriptional regulator